MSYFPSTMCFRFTGLLSSVVLLTVIAMGAHQPDYRAVADRIVGQCVNVTEGDRVVVRGDARDFDLIEEINLAVAKRGAEAIQIVGRERAARRYFDEVPAKFDELPPNLELKLVEAQTVDIRIEGQEFPGLLADVPRERLATVIQRYDALFAAQLKHNVRSVFLGNGLYPTEATARNFGLTKEQLHEIFWQGINVDYTALQATAAKLRAKLAAGKELRVTHPNGTDLKFSIEGRPAFASDGVISPEDVAQGGPAVHVWLPAGEVYLAPVPGTARGTIVIDHLPFEASIIENATFTIEAGQLTKHTAKPSAAYQSWSRLYDAGPEGKEEFGFVDIGINPNVKVPPGSKLVSWVASGMVTLGTGGNNWAGGSNTSLIGAVGSLNGATVTLDGQTIVDRGELSVQ